MPERLLKIRLRNMSRHMRVRKSGDFPTGEITMRIAP
jgi:hypothetical protein